MHWNHRVVSNPAENGGDPWFEICEVFYNEAGKPCGYSQMCLGGEDLDEITQTLFRMTKAMGQAVLKYPEDFTGNLEDDQEGESNAST